MIALLSRIPWLRIAVLIILLFVFQLLRWQIVSGSGDGATSVYRLDRISGNVELSIAGSDWIKVGDSRPAEGNSEPVKEWNPFK